MAGSPVAGGAVAAAPERVFCGVGARPVARYGHRPGEACMRMFFRELHAASLTWRNAMRRVIGTFLALLVLGLACSGHRAGRRCPARRHGHGRLAWGSFFGDNVSSDRTPPCPRRICPSQTPGRLFRWEAPIAPSTPCWRMARSGPGPGNPW